jgi:hypothetical protein
MKAYRPSLNFILILTSLSLALPFGAQADAYVSATGGSGPNGYRSTEVSADADLFNTPLSLNILGFKSSSTAQEDVSQSVLGLDWNISQLATAGIKHNKANNGSIDIQGNALSLALSLNALWNSELLTRVDLKRANSAYQFNDLPQAVDTINQTENSFGITQYLSESWSLYGGHDQYSYDRDPKSAASVLYRTALLNHTLRKYVNTSSSLMSFPDKTDRLGITWQLLEPLMLDLSGSKTTTELDQTIKTTRLGIDYQVTDHLDVSVAVSRVAATAVVAKRDIKLRPGGITLIPAGSTLMTATDDTYTEFSLGWTF